MFQGKHVVAAGIAVASIPLMTRVAGLCALLFGTTFAACTAGDEPNTNPNPNGRNCTASLSVRGSFVPDNTVPMPTGYAGCWPEGMWTFTASVDNSDCKDTPMLANQYQFKAVGSLDDAGDPVVKDFNLITPDPSTFYYAPTMKNWVVIKVSELGNAICEGEVDLYLPPDGKTMWSFRPDLQQAVNTSLTGQGEYAEFTTNQWPY
jgi:hypothetical protein